MLEFLTVLPWILLVLALPLLLWRKPRLSDMPPLEGEMPLVSVIVPARNEAQDIGLCLATLLDSEYPNYEVIVVDDGSEDGTGDIVAELARRTDGRLRLVTGEPLPAGWIGKPWACWQGYRHASGSLLLFTDADTRHGPTLTEKAVAALRMRGADLVTVLPYQKLVSFWERAIMPQVWLAMTLRFPNLKAINRTRDPREVLANGQFLLFRRVAYDRIGGHQAVRSCVVEDLRLAQRLIAAGRRMFIAHADDLMETRMYRSLSDLVEGWSKNIAQGAAMTVAAWARPVIPWFIAFFPMAFWTAPPLVLLANVLGIFDGWTAWALWTTTLSVVFWLAVCLRMGLSAGNAAAYPLGAIATSLIFARSALRGRRVSWKGRSYEIGPEAEEASG